jgi:hypothetical protein
MSFGSVVTNSAGSLTASAFVGNVGALTLNNLIPLSGTPSAPFYSVTGGNNGASGVPIVITPNGTGYTVSDPTDGAQVSVTINASTGATTGSVYSDTDLSTPLASFQMDQFGTGSLTYAAGGGISIVGFTPIF